ncbi:MAG: hypothetical protein ACFFG0_40275 [Candidatus Thorarchaeota archaeon]
MIRIYPTIERIANESYIKYSPKMSKIAKRVYNESYAEYFNKKIHKSMDHSMRIDKSHEYACSMLKKYYEFADRNRGRPD